MAIKFNPVYRVKVYSNTETTEIELPLTCQMNISRSLLSQNTSATIQIYNLSQETRNKIYQPPFSAFSEKQKLVTVEAGYGDLNSSYQIFFGVILQAFSHKEGASTDVITEIQAQSLDVLTAYSSHQFEAGTDKRDIFKTLAGDLPNCSLGNIGELSGKIELPTTFEGNTFEQLNKLTGGNTFVDNGQVNCLLQNEVIDVPVPIISDDSVLLATPRRNAANLTIKTLFHPDLIVGQLVEINSHIETDYNGQHKVVGITHDLFFSASQSGQRTTTIELIFTKALEASPLSFTGNEPKQAPVKVKKEEVTPLTPKQLTEKWIMPCKGAITSGFGRRQKPTENASTNHNGIDIGVPIGTPIKAVASGTVCAVGKAKGYGNWVAINHGVINGKTVTSEYGHISSWQVRVGQRVQKGQQIALSGNAGTSTGPHLHLTIREGIFQGVGVDPKKYISV